MQHENWNASRQWTIHTGQNVSSKYFIFPPVTDNVTVIAEGRCLLPCTMHVNWLSKSRAWECGP